MSFFPFIYINGRHKALRFWGEGSGHSVLCSKGTLLATFADPFNNTIYNHSSIAICAAITKIPHSLYEEVLLKNPRLMNDFIYKYDLFTMNMMGMGEKTPKYIQKQKTKEKSPVWLPSHPPVYIPGRKNRKQAGPTLGGMGILIYRAKRNKGLGAVWVDTTR